MVDPGSQAARELKYSTLTASQLTWQVAPPYLLTTVNQPARRLVGREWRWIAVLWAGTFAAGLRLTGFDVLRALAVGVWVIAVQVLAIVLGLLALPRHLSVRVSGEKLLIDECSGGRTLPTGSHGVNVPVRGRSYAREEVVSVVAAGGSLRVRAKVRGRGFSAGGYDRSDLAWTADTVTKVLEDGLEAWVAARQ